MSSPSSFSLSPLFLTPLSCLFCFCCPQFNHSPKKAMTGSRSMARRKDSNSPLSNSKSATALGSPGKPSTAFGQSQAHLSSAAEGFTSKEPLIRSRSSENIEVRPYPPPRFPSSLPSLTPLSGGWQQIKFLSPHSSLRLFSCGLRIR
jgi:hypothetical protein